MGLKPKETPRPFTFGTAAHSGLEEGYNPKTWYMMQDPEKRPFMVARTLDVFHRSMEESRARYLKLTGKEGLEPEQLEEYLADLELGQGMLLHYWDYVDRHNMDRFTPVATEISFSVPIFHPDDVEALFPELCRQARMDGYAGAIIVYKGRIDLLLQDDWGEYWIWDHKTTSRVKDTMGFLEMDEQLGSYNWAAQQMLGIKIAGNVYAELFKGYPLPPQRMKVQRLGRNYSTNKQYPTSYDLAKETLEKAGEDMTLYEDYLQFLKEEGIPYVRRTPVHRNQHELTEIGQRIKDEVIEMLDPNLKMYPHPTPFACDHCPFRMPCVATNDGSDVEWILQTNYTKEKRTNA